MNGVMFWEEAVSLVSAVHFRPFFSGVNDSEDLVAFNRGSNDVWDNWANLTGDSQWSWDSIEPYYLKVRIRLAFHASPAYMNNHRRPVLFPPLITTTLLVRLFHPPTVLAPWRLACPASLPSWTILSSIRPKQSVGASLTRRTGTRATLRG